MRKICSTCAHDGTHKRTTGNYVRSHWLRLLLSPFTPSSETEFPADVNCKHNWPRFTPAALPPQRLRTGLAALTLLPGHDTKTPQPCRTHPKVAKLWSCHECFDITLLKMPLGKECMHSCNHLPAILAINAFKCSYTPFNALFHSLSHFGIAYAGIQI